MFETIQKAVFAAVGAGHLTKEKMEELGKKIVAEAKVSEKEGRKFVEELVKKSETTRLAIEKAVDDAVSAALTKLDVPRRKEIAALEKRVSDLEKSK